MTGKPCAIEPLLVDANQGARILGISPPHFHKFMRKNATIQPVTLGSLTMWRRKDLFRFTGKRYEPHDAGDILIDAQAIAALCSISRSMVYKLNKLRILPDPMLDGRTLRWSVRAIEEWVDKGCQKCGEKNPREEK